MAVQVAVVDRCLTCHEIAETHLSAPGDTCASCHLPLAESHRLLEADVEAFDAPPSHRDPGFAGTGHGQFGPASCATCHARDFCLVCHVDAPEQPAIQMLGVDPRSLLHAAELRAPTDHRVEGFLSTHAPDGRVETCITCHTRESCWSCHVSTPEVATPLFGGAAGRGAGAQVERRRPDTHGAGFTNAHGPAAATAPERCAGCHARDECLDCHRPSAGATGAYHPPGFLVSHPAASYARETSCADCHDPRSFCTSCHANASLGSTRALLGAGYHDGNRAFAFGHGQAARQTLESCVTCHTEQDCLTCHSAAGGRRFNPHGPGFDPVRLREKAGQMCTVCHNN